MPMAARFEVPTLHRSGINRGQDEDFEGEHYSQLFNDDDETGVTLKTLRRAKKGEK